MLTTFTLKRVHGAVREPSAWFLPGGDPVAWLDEISRWPVAAETVSFFLIAENGSSNPAGVLVVPPAGMHLPPGGRAQPFGLVAPGTFLPVDALVWPPATAGELRAAAKFSVLIFHPALGLTGCDEADRRQVWDLLAAPAFAANEDWSVARAGATSGAGLGAVRMAAMLSLDSLFGEESKEIGSETPEALPPSPREPGNSLAVRAAGGAAAVLVTALLGVTSRLPRTARAPTWVNALENWAQSKLAGVTRDMERRRHRELHRLLDLLASNPEEGLRHAISLADLANRGRAAAAARLARRALDFDLRRLSGGRPADAWGVPEELRSSLAKSYREMAMRETRLGRHRRAACIFAELLGDFAAAAGALKEGRHFREAALLYRERLNNPLAAAACLAEGGLVADALSIYEKHARWIEAADLHARLGDEVAERAAVRRAVDAHIVAGDMVAAARLIETRLAAPDEALVLLASTWPSGRQALICLEERLALLTRLRRSAGVCELLAMVREESTPMFTVAPLTGLLAKFFEAATDAGVRQAVVDTVRVKAVAGLAGYALERADELAVLRALTRLAPEDRLLARDVQRFRDARPKALPVPVPTRAAGEFVLRVTPERAGTITLPKIGVWSRVVTGPRGFFAVARMLDGKIFFCRGSWKDGIQSVDFPDPAPDRGSLFLMVVRENRVFLARPFATGLAGKVLPPTDVFHGEMCRVGTPSWLPEDAVQCAGSVAALWVVRVVGTRVVLECFQEDRRVDSCDVTDELMAAGATGGGTSLVLDAQGITGQVAMSYGQHLLVREESGELRVTDLGARIVGLVSGPWQAPGWIALLERGAVYVTATPEGTYAVTSIDGQLEQPRGTVLGDGRLVLVGGEEGWVFRWNQNAAVTRVAQFSLPGGAGIALVSTPHPREFAVFTEKGGVQRWQLAV